MRIRRLVVALYTFAAGAGLYVSTAEDARAQQSEWKHCSEWNGAFACQTCVRSIDCSAASTVCCKDPVGS
jgi:hypothetical protein